MILVANYGDFSIDFATTEEVKIPVKSHRESVKTKKQEEREELSEEEITLGKYRHFKGNEYEVLGFAKDSESTNKVVIYQALYGDKELWVRPYDMFKEIIERDGKKIRRFTKID